MRTHYTRQPLAERFWPKVRQDGPVPAHRPDLGPCWLWLACLDGHGYGRIGAGGKHGPMLAAHRVAWELANGPIPEGLVTDHLCRNPPCVNPAHLEIVTQGENIRRAVSHGRGPQATCGKGHPMSGGNLYVNPTTGQRGCRSCIREWGHQQYLKRRALA